MSTTNQQQGEDIIADYTEEITQIRMEGNQMAVRKARNALFWAGGLIFFWEMVAMYRLGLGFDPTVFAFALVEGGIFVALAFWTKTKPYTAVVTGLIAFCLMILLTVIINGMDDGADGVIKGLFSGILVRVIIIVNLVRPLKDAKELQEWLVEKKRSA